jgi:alpha-beta hydrolase superfamily lysophospholipase
MRLYADARHEVHNDPGRAEAFPDAFAFLDRHLAAP